MKIEGIKGEFYFQALISTAQGIKLCSCFHNSLSSAKLQHSDKFPRWPAELLDNNTVYIPSEEEL